MVGIDPETDFTVGPWLEEHAGGKLADDEVILGANAHIFFGKSESHVGDVEFFYGRPFKVVGILEATGLGIDDDAFITLDAAYELSSESNVDAVEKADIEPGQISTVMVKVDPRYDRADVARNISLQVPGTAGVTSKELMATSLSRQLQTLTPGLLLIGAGFWFISVLMIGALFTMIVNERRRELGLLQAMGATRGFIFREVMLEAVELTLLGGVTGIVAGSVLILVLKGPVADSLGVEFVWPSASYLVVFTVGYLLLAALTGALAALYPAVSASRLEPYQAIRSGE